MPLRPPHRRILAGALGVVLLSGVGLVLLERALEAALRAPVDAYLRARTLRMANGAPGSGLDIALPVLRLSLFRRRLVLEQVRIQFDQTRDSVALHFVAEAPVITLSGLDLSDVIWRRNFRLSGVSLERPTLRREVEGPADRTAPRAAPPDSLPVTLPAPDSLLYRLVAGWLPDEVRGGRIERVRVTDATISSRERRGTRAVRDSTTGLSLELRGLQLDSTAHRVFEYGTLRLATARHATGVPTDSLQVERVQLTMSADDTTFDIGELRSAATAGGHQFRAVGLRRSFARQLLTVDTVRYGPVHADSMFFAAAGPRSTRVRAALTGIRVLGMRQENLRHRRLTAGGVWVGEATLDVLADRRTPAGPPRARVLWPAQFLGWDVVVGADSIVIEDGAIRYGELAPGRAQPGAVSFEQLRATVHRLSNDSVMTRAGPARLEASARLFGQGALRATIEVAIRPGPLQVRAHGDLGRLDLTRFNRFLLPANGMEITAGTLQAAQFRVVVAGGQASGAFGAAWDGLELRLVDPVTGRQNLGKKLKSMVAGRLVRSRQSVDPDGALRTAPIAYRQEPGDSFWGLLWRAVRSGMVKSVKP